MRTNGGCSALASALIIGVWASAAAAQTEWDVDQYQRWIAVGQARYEEAVGLPEEAVGRRQELLVESAEAKLLAREMLRAGLLQGAVEYDRAGAISEYFNLTENLVVSLADADQCEAAALLMVQVEADSAIIPADALGYLPTMQPTITECRERNRPVDLGWDGARYAWLVDEAESWLARAEQVGDAADRHGLLFESVLSRHEALDLLRGEILARGEAPGLEDPLTLLFGHYPPLIDALVELGLCTVAERRLQQWQFDAVLLRDEAAPGPDAERQLAACGGADAGN
jgi:hypothetical protein